MYDNSESRVKRLLSKKMKSYDAKISSLKLEIKGLGEKWETYWWFGETENWTWSAWHLHHSTLAVPQHSPIHCYHTHAYTPFHTRFMPTSSSHFHTYISCPLPFHTHAYHQFLHIYILPYPSYPLYPYILPLIPLFDTHSFTKSLFSHPTHCLSPFFSSPFVTHESTSFVSLHVIILTRIRPSYSASFVHFWLHIHLIPFPTLFYPYSYFTLHIFPLFH